MKNYSIWDFLRYCPGCVQSNYEGPWLCHLCLSHFLKRVGVKRRHENPTSHTYLIDWRPDDRFMTDIVNSLKGGVVDQPYELLVSLFLKKSIRPPFDVIYYPSKGPFDHASKMATLISEELGCPAFPILKQGRSKQSLLSRKSRREQRFQSLPCQGDYPLFVDDVLTTGETLRACYRALNQPSNMTVWTLFYRNIL